MKKYTLPLITKKTKPQWDIISPQSEIPMAGEAAETGELPHATDGNVQENSYYGTQYGGFSEH